MRLLLIVNPRSGRGKGELLAAAFADPLARAGHRVDRTLTPAPGSPPVDLRGFDAAVVFGGDGTVHDLLPGLTASQAAVYHVPTGTENLFARQFGMDRAPATLLSALRAWRVEPIDLGDANGRLFALMCSAGPDASVVRRLAATRSGVIRHWSYARPILLEALSPALGPITVSVDGETIVHESRGMLVMGNSPMYALGLNPARDARLDDALLDAVFLPASHSISWVGWAYRAATRTLLSRPRVVFRRGTTVSVESENGVPYQLDGDDGGVIGPGQHLEVRVRPGALRILRADRESAAAQ